MLRIKRTAASPASATSSSPGVTLPPVRAAQVPPKHVFRRLAAFQTTMLGLIIGLSCIVLIYLVLIYLHGGFAPRPADAVAPQEPVHDAHSPPQANPVLTLLPQFGEHSSGDTKPSQASSPTGTKSGKGVHVQQGARSDMIRWRFKVEDEDDHIVALFTGRAGTACISSTSEKLGHGGMRLDVVSASGKIVGSATQKKYSSVLAAGIDGALYRHVSTTGKSQEHSYNLGAFDIGGRLLWQAQLPHPFTGEIAVSGKGTVFAIGRTARAMPEKQAQSCLCAISASGKIKWTFEREGYLSWPLPLEDGGVLVWSRPRLDRWDSMQYSYDVKSHPELAQLSVNLMCLDRDGKLRWSYDVGHVDAGNATAAAGKVCAQSIDAAGAHGQELVVLALSSGRETARYPSGPLSAPPLILPEGAVLFQNQAHVLVKLSPKMKVLWTKALHNPLRQAPLTDREGAIYYAEFGALVCLEQNGSERFAIPVDGHVAMWGPDGLIYVQGSREVQAFQPE